MNTRKIQPVITWTSNGAKSINVLALYNFTEYHFDNGAGLVQYKLIGSDEELGATIYIDSKIEIPASIIQQWGESDEIIFTYVANQLGLTIIND